MGQSDEDDQWFVPRSGYRRRRKGEPISFIEYLIFGFMILLVLLIILMTLEGFLPIVFLIAPLIICPIATLIAGLISDMQDKKQRRLGIEKRRMSCVEWFLCVIIIIINFMIFIWSTEGYFDYHLIIPLWMVVFAVPCIIALLRPPSTKKDDDKPPKFDPGIFSEE